MSINSMPDLDVKTDPAVTPITPIADTPPVNPVQNPEVKPKKVVKWIFILIPVVSILLILIILYVYFTWEKGNKNTALEGGINNEIVNDQNKNEEIINEEVVNENKKEDGDDSEEVSTSIPLNTYFYVITAEDKYTNNLRYVDVNGKVGSLNYDVYGATPSYGNRYVVFSQKVEYDKIKLSVLDKTSGKVIDDIDISIPSKTELSPELFKNSISPDGKKVFIHINFQYTEMDSVDYESRGYGMYIYEFSTKKLTEITSKVAESWPICSIWNVLWSKDSSNLYIDLGSNACVTYKEVDGKNQTEGLIGIYKYNLSDKTFANVYETDPYTEGLYLENIDKFILFRSYFSFQDKEEVDMSEIVLEKGDEKKVLFSGEYASIQPVSDISPDSSKFTTVKGKGIIVSDMNGKELAKIENSDPSAYVNYSDWIDNTKLIITIMFDKESKGTSTDLYLYDITNKSIKKLTTSNDVQFNTM